MPEMTVRASTGGFPGLRRGRWASSVFHVSSDSQHKLLAMTSASSDSNHDKKYTMESTLCMGSQPSPFYAKRTPLFDDDQWVIVGVAKVTSVGDLRDWIMRGDGGQIRSYLWER